MVEPIGTSGAPQGRNNRSRGTGRHNGGRPPGMMDVARRAGVSHQTVSRVLNDPGSVRPQTLDKVRAAISELGYRRNMAARALVTASSRLIGVITSSSHFLGPASTASAIELAARRAGYATLVASLQVGDRAEIDNALGFLISRGVDGIIAVAPRTGIAQALGGAARTAPMVVVAAGVDPGERIHVVSVDQELGAAMAVHHLAGRGCRDIAHVAGPGDWFDARSRSRGWLTALEDSGLEPGAELIGDWSPGSGYRAGAVLLGRRTPQAVFCANDLMALGVLAAARESGARVPEDLAVVGYDDVAGAEYFVPALTTVRQPFDELGRLCMEVLLEAMDGQPGAVHSIPPRLCVRRSSQWGAPEPG